MSAKQIIDIYISFFEKRGHKRIPNSPLVPENDPTTLFTSSGMQPLVPYLLGQEHPEGNRLVDVQNCFRAVDIDEVGDNRHTTFFRMLGNWSLGDYFKKEEIPWLWELLTKELGLPKEKLYITVFKGNNEIPFDQEAEDLWKEVFEKEGLEPKIFHDPSNWWSRSGMPEKMPAGEPGGPDTEVYYRFDDVEHKPKCEDDPTKCECGKFLEIANSVFMQYLKQVDGSFKELPKLNVDFGGGLERLLAAVEDKSDIFQTSLFAPIIASVEENSKGSYSNPDHQKSIRIIADHLKSATYMIASGIRPANKDRGYILRRLIRRSAVKMHELNGGLTPIPGFQLICDQILNNEEEISQGILERGRDRETIFQVIQEEMEKFGTSLDKGLKVINKYDDSQLNAVNAFNLFQTYGFPFEITEELFKKRGKTLDKKEFNNVLEAHKNLSRTASSGMFKGGLADGAEQTVRGHTATHLMHQAIRDMLGTQVHQSGSNITSERVRFDFNFDRNLTDEELQKLEQTVNEKIKAKMPVYFEFMPLSRAKEIGAIGLFDDKYSDKVKIYLIGDKNPEKAYSKEFCGGPHVNFTDEVKSFKIIKQENIGNGLRRLYVTVG